MLYFCTLFNKNYFSRGLAMYDSLKKHCNSFHLYIFAFDEITYSILKRMKLDSATIISLEELENEVLLSVKADRSFGEYCWTCTPSTISYVLDNYSHDHCTYIDADIYFYRDPLILFNELNKNSILITEHRYTKKYDQTETSGKYCVQFITFKNNEYGLKALDWWEERCIEWCYNRVEKGKFGDQKYLDDWPERFEQTHELKHLGGGVAPWNVQQYEIMSLDGRLYGVEKDTERKFELVFYHFHNLKINRDNSVLLSHCYELSASVIENVYFPYLLQLEQAKNDILKYNSSIDPHGVCESVNNRVENFEITKLINLFVKEPLTFFSQAIEFFRRKKLNRKNLVKTEQYK